MLLQAVHIPRLYSDVPPETDGARRYCAHVLNLLRDVERNCLLLVDGGNVMTGEMFRALRNWPQQHRKLCQRLLTELRVRNRLVKMERDGTAEVACAMSGCRCALAIARDESPDIVMGAEKCSGCVSLAANGVTLTEIHDYPLSPFAESRRSAEIVALADGEWDRTRFEREVWQPLFRYAKHVKIFDRYVGRHLQRGDGGYRPTMGEAYARSLEWILNQFVTLSTGRAARRFEVTCGLQSDRLSPEAIAGAAAVLRGFARTLFDRYGVETAVNVKVESGAREMAHARCIITDQVALNVERGFDLLRPDGGVRDVVITHLPNRGEIESQARSLDDAPDGAVP